MRFAFFWRHKKRVLLDFPPAVVDQCDTCKRYDRIQWLILSMLKLPQLPPTEIGQSKLSGIPGITWRRKDREIKMYAPRKFNKVERLTRRDVVKNDCWNTKQSRDWIHLPTTVSTPRLTTVDQGSQEPISWFGSLRFWFWSGSSWIVFLGNRFRWFTSEKRSNQPSWPMVP